jgi:predicted acetyltransferase
MTYRAILPAELPQWRALDEYSFQVPPERFEAFLTTTFRYADSRGVFNSDGKMVASLSLYPYGVYMEGARLGLGGIAGVASAPEHRRGGHVGRGLIGAIAEMKERAIPLSALYPFKQAFYRRYGWEVAAAWLEHKLPVEALSAFRKSGGSVTKYLPGQAPLDDLRQVYTPWAIPRRGRLVRESDWHWNGFVIGTATPPRYTAVWRPEPGAAPEGYLIYRLHEGQFQVREMVALSDAARRGLLGFAANHDSQVKHVVLRTERDYPLWHLAENTYEVESKLASGWQLRLVDVAAAFEGRPWPAGVQGSLTLQVQDEHAPWNAGTWRVTFEAGHAAVRQAPEATPDLSASVQTWAQLYAGFLAPDQAVETGMLACSDPAALRLLADALRGPAVDFTDAF